MNRRIFLRFLSLPVILPLARKVQAAVHHVRYRSPSYVTLDLDLQSPVYVKITVDGAEGERLVLPVKGRHCYYIPVPADISKEVRVVLASPAAPFKMYNYTLEGVKPIEQIAESRDVDR